MSDLEQTVGLAVADLVALEFDKMISQGSVPGIRLTGFNEAEVPYIVSRLLQRQLQLTGHDEPVKIVVGTATPQPGIPSDVILAPGWTMTRHRNSNDHGLVLIDLDPQGDETGIKAMHTLSDSDLLNNADQGVVRKRIRQIATIDWEVASPSNPIEVPEPLLDSFETVFEGLTKARRPSLREWVTYTIAVDRALVDLHRAVAGPEIRSVAAAELRSINLFPDPQLFDGKGSPERRLVKNAYMAELRTPQGKNLRDEDLSAWIDSVQLRDVDGTERSTDDSDRLKATMRRIVAEGGPDTSLFVQLSDWEQLFEKKRTTPGLSSQIRGFLEQSHPARLDEYDDLAVEDALADGDEEAARTFLEAEPVDGEVQLAELLPVGLRKKLERLVFQGERIEQDPLIAILFGLNAYEGDERIGESRSVTLEWEATTHTAWRSASLFGFLYRSTLEEVAASCDGSIGTTFRLDESIVKIDSIESLFPEDFDPDDDDADDNLQKSWGALRFKLVVTGSSTPLIRFKWDPRLVPGLAAFALLIRSGGVSRPIQMSTLENWCDQAFEPVVVIDPDLDQEDSDIESDDGVRLSAAWATLNREHFRKWTATGLNTSFLDEFLDEWFPLLELARQDFVPNGGSLSALDKFLEHETGVTDAGHLVMLGSHPLRLRWLRNHMENLGLFITRALMGELRLNPENDRLFFDWIERASPHLQPPVMSGGKLMLAKAVREVQLHEEYATVRSSEGQPPEWLSSLDDASIDELVAITRTFVSSFPQKERGLSVLLMASSDASAVARRFVTRLRQRDSRKPRSGTARCDARGRP